ncbi:MAG: HTTM domain-containing protein [Planctomycetaceae bacterium]
MHTPQSQPSSSRLARFFFAEEVPVGMVLMRICLPLALLVAAVPRWSRARELYSSDGATAPLWSNFDMPGLLPIPSASVAIALFTLLICLLVCLSVGWQSRLSAALACVLTAYIGMLDSLSSLTKYTCIASHLLLLLSLSDCGVMWSVDAWLAGRRGVWPGEPGVGRRRSPVWPRRLAQLLIAIIYLAAAVTKMQTPAFFSGDQMYYWLLSNTNFANPLGEYLSLFPSMLVAMGLATIVWEIVFICLCWRGFGRTAVLGVGVVFHLLTTLILGLIVFPLVCLSAYFTYFDEADYQYAAQWLRKVARRSRRLGYLVQWTRPAAGPRPTLATPRNSALAFGGLLCVGVMVGLEAEHRLDLYGLRRAEGPYTLPIIPDDQARKMLSGSERIRKQDMFLQFDVGTTAFGGRLANHRDEFTHGETAILQCSVIPPHEDLWVEINLHDADDRLIERNGQVMTREKVHGHFKQEWFESYAPGEYVFVLKLNGDEVSRLPVTLHATDSAAAATAKGSVTPVDPLPALAAGHVDITH